jgi:hypothetical protein
MSSGKYDSGRQAFAFGLNWSTADIRVLPVSADYVPNFAAHASLADVPVLNRIAPAVTVPGRAASAGWLTFTPITFEAVSGTQPPIAGAVFYVYNDDEALTDLLFLKAPAPVQPNGGDVTYPCPTPGVIRL